MKVCDLTQFYSPVSGGVKRYVHEKIAYIREHAGDSHVLIIPGEKDEKIVDGPSTIYTLRSPLVSKTSRYRALLRLAAVDAILAAEMPDVIESGDPYQMAWKAIASGQRLHIPVVGFYHSHFPEAYIRTVMKFFGRFASDIAMNLAERYVRNLYNRFAKTLVPSPALARVLQNWGLRNVENIDLGVNTNIFRPEPDDAAQTRAELNLPADRVILLYVGRLAPEKNTRTLFDAFELLTKAHPGRFHLMAVGDGTQRSLLVRLRDVTGEVTWLPYCSESHRLAQLYRAADLFVHPGIQETFGLVTLESQACGTPVVGIRGSYMDRIILDDQAHWGSSNTPEALAEAIQAACQLDLSGAGEHVSRKALQQYSWTQVFDRLFAIYRSLVRS